MHLQTDSYGQPLPSVTCCHPSGDTDSTLVLRPILAQNRRSFDMIPLRFRIVLLNVVCYFQIERGAFGQTDSAFWPPYLDEKYLNR